MPTAAFQALERLKAGNRRFVSGMRNPDTMSHRQWVATVREQQPFAIILGCSDARVPAEVVFDQGLGDLFVIRVAGNIVAPSQVGSVEFAADRFGTPLVVVMGHTECGAVMTTLDEVRSPSSHSPNLRSIVDRIRPVVDTLLATDLRHDQPRLLREAVRANVRASATHLRHGSVLLEQLISEKSLLVVGAEYSLATGEVDFFDGVETGT
jgi:carbonic anhydrase